MTSLVGGSLSEVEAGSRAAGHGVLEDGAAVADVGGGAGGGAGGEVAVSEVAADLVEEVDVEGGVGAAAEGLLHGHLVAVTGPDRVDGAGVAGVAEVDAVRGEVAGEDIELPLESSNLSRGVISVFVFSLGESESQKLVPGGQTYRGESALGGRDGVEPDVNGDGSLDGETVLSSSSLLEGELLGNSKILLGGLGSTTAEAGDAAAESSTGEEEESLDRHGE